MYEISKGLVIGARSSANLFGRLVKTIVDEFEALLLQEFGESTNVCYFVDDMLIPCSLELWNHREVVVWLLKKILTKYHMEINTDKLLFLSPESKSFVFVGRTFHYEQVVEDKKNINIKIPADSLLPSFIFFLRLFFSFVYFFGCVLSDHFAIG